MGEYEHTCDCPKCGGKRTAKHPAYHEVGRERISCSVCGVVYDDEAGLDERSDKTKPACNVCGIPIGD